MKILQRALAFFTGTLLTAMVLLSVTQVFFRYALNLSLAWVEELIRLCFVWFTLVGAPLAMLHGGDHMKVDYFVSRLPARLHRLVGLCGGILALGFAVVLFVNGIRLTAVMSDQTFSSFKVSLAYSGAAIPAGGLLIILSILHHLRSVVGQGGKDGER